jgi:hypothetical protein
MTAKQLRKLESNRWRRFVEFAELRRETEMAQAFLEELKSSRADLQREIEGQTIADWLR